MTADPTAIRHPSPVGRPRWPWRIVKYRAAERPPLLTLNRYPRQAIGILIRLPKNDDALGFPVLSVLWARPSRWWK